MLRIKKIVSLESVRDGLMFNSNKYITHQQRNRRNEKRMSYYWNNTIYYTIYITVRAFLPLYCIIIFERKKYEEERFIEIICV